MRLATGGRHVAHHIADTAQHGFITLGAENGDWRLGRDPFHRAVDITVQHQIAQAGDLPTVDFI